MYEQLTIPLDGSMCQRWTGRRPSWRRTSEGGFNPVRYAVGPIEEDDARGFVQTHHYSRAYPAARLRYGLFDRLAGDRLVGVAVLGVPMRSLVLTNPFPTLEPYRQSLELSRLVLLDEVPGNAETWFLTRALDQAAARGIRGVVMFSDPLPRRIDGVLTMPGHVGIVYQALNCTYTGRGKARTLTVLPDGMVLSDRSAQKIRAGERGAAGVVTRLVDLGATEPGRLIRLTPAEWLAYALAEIGAEQVRHLGNHRYVLALGERRARRGTRVGFPAKQFPKLPDSIGA